MLLGIILFKKEKNLTLEFHYLTHAHRTKSSERSFTRPAVSFKNFTFPLKVHAKSLTQLSAKRPARPGVMSCVRASLGPRGFTVLF